MTKITYLVQDPDGDYGALYIDGNLILDFETYEMTPLEVFQFLEKNNLLKSDVEFEEENIEFIDRVAFPSTLDELDDVKP